MTISKACAPLNQITYKTHARSTGATICAGRTKDGWATQCLSQGTLVAHPTRAQAEALASQPEKWCEDGCARIASGDAPKLGKETWLDKLL